MLRLYSYFRSSAVFRVRIALNLKGLSHEVIPVHLMRDGGQQHAPDFAKRNPSHLVPVLEDDAETITQSLAIIEYLDEQYPMPPLLPRKPAERAKIRSLALDVACDIHPLNNLRVMQYLTDSLGVDEEKRAAWMKHWMTLGLTAIEQKLKSTATGSGYCYGESPTLADCCLVPQTFNALRLKCPVDSFPTVMRIYETCMKLPAFEKAAPGAQPDAE
jgi:maleylacetoacetate isomerase